MLYFPLTNAHAEFREKWKFHRNRLIPRFGSKFRILQKTVVPNHQSCNSSTLVQSELQLSCRRSSTLVQSELPYFGMFVKFP